MSASESPPKDPTASTPPVRELRNIDSEPVEDGLEQAPLTPEEDETGWDPEVIAQEEQSVRLDRWKAQLLDLSMRNRLLNLRPNNTLLPFVLEDPAAVHEQLLGHQSLRLIHRPDLSPVGEGGEAQRQQERQQAAAELLGSGTVQADQAEGSFRTTTVSLFREARNAEEDSGYSPLFLCLGMLRWFESPSSDTPRIAPLILIPVTLSRDSVRGPYRLTARGEGTTLNPTFLHLMESEFGIPSSRLGLVMDAEGALDFRATFGKIQQTFETFPRFEVLPQSALALLRYENILLYNDLEAHLDDFLRNPVVARLLDKNAPPLPEPGKFFSAKDLDQLSWNDDLSVDLADSSQLAAVMTGVYGNSFVLQGPPGTGKSQTITNLISNFLARGKTVLFVAEKRAALEVVQRRLAKVGLAPFVLEAHTDKPQGRSAILEQFREPLEIKWPRESDAWDEHLRQLDTVRKELAAHVERMHRPGPFGESLYQAMGSRLENRTVQVFPLEGTTTPTQSEVAAMTEAVQRLADASVLVGPPEEHAFHGRTLLRWGPTMERQVGQAAQELRGKAYALQTSWTPVAQRLGVSADRLPGAWAKALSDLRSTPPLSAALLTEPQSRIDDLFGRIEACVVERAGRQDDVEQAFTPNVLELPSLPTLHAQFERWAWTLALLAWIMLWGARRRLAPYAKTQRLLPSRELLRPLKAANELAGLDTQLDELRKEALPLFGSVWQRGVPDLELLRVMRERARSIRRLLERGDTDEATVQTIRDWLVDPQDSFSPGGERGRQIEALENAVQNLDHAKDALNELLPPDEGYTWPSTFAAFDAQMTQMANDLSALRDWSAWCQAVRDVKAHKLDILVQRLEDGSLKASQLQLSLMGSIREDWINSRFDEDEELAQFHGVTHNSRIQRFQKMESEMLGLAREVVRGRCAARLPDPHAPGPMETLRKEIRKKRRQMPVRQLFSELGDIALRIKPCVLMSPQSVASYLDPSAATFDVVIFDEASQIPPWSAVGALARAKQAIVVGDSKQLPPTSFFQRQAPDSDHYDEEDPQDIESILEHCIISGFREQTLDWHYRSQHESLIEFSDKRYYDGRLLVFPSANHSRETRGLRRIDVPGGVYDRGGTRTNRKEAEALVDHLINAIQDPETSDRTYGVVTFALPQRELIEDLIDQRCSEDPEVLTAVRSLRENLFVRNIESVQGDERDVIYFSVGYGPDAAGKVYANFGPLTKTGGQRRLNVAVTRSKIQMLVFSTLRPDQIDLRRTGAQGVWHLREFLELADAGARTLQQEHAGSASHDNAPSVVRSIAEELESREWKVLTGVGLAGYQVDLSVEHPQEPGLMFLGVQIDGEQYARSATVRDRDRLQPSALERLGWRIHYIWTADWWLNRNGEVKRLLDVLEQAGEEGRNWEPDGIELTPPPPEQFDRIALEDSAEGSMRWEPPAVPWTGLPQIAGGHRDNFLKPTSNQLITRQIQAVLAVAAPVSSQHLTQHIRAAWGYARNGKNLVERVEALAALSGAKIRHGDVWRADQDPGTWQGFRYVVGSGEPRAFHQIPRVELDNAVVALVKSSLRLQREDLITRCPRVVFAMGSTGSQIRGIMEASIDRLLSQGRLISDENSGMIRVPD